MNNSPPVAKDKLELPDCQIFLEKSLKSARENYSKGMRISVGFFILYDSAFPGESLYNLLKNSDEFSPTIILIPDTMRGRENMIFQLEKSYNTFSQKYEEIKFGYDIKNDSFVDFSNQLDFVCFSNPYDCLTHEYFQISHIVKKDVVPFFINYTFSVSLYDRKVIALNEFNFFWKIFCSTPENLIELIDFSQMKGKNALVVGYPKMDALESTQDYPRVRKRIIIAPHHTVSQWDGGVNLSSFLKYANFFLDLPYLYPDIDFIFRPHPLLFVTLQQNEFWGMDKVTEYLRSLLKHKNVVYSEGSDYFDLFKNSDALIHDCGSFVAEYLYTDKPSCFIFSRPNVILEEFAPIGKACLQHHYHATSKNDIISFIDYVIISENDNMKMERLKFVNRRLKVNYPYSSSKILEEIKKYLQF